jgi:magnesium-transporting ATPase (P-type)
LTDLTPPPVQDWHARTAHDVLAALRARVHGLSAAEAARRLAEAGPNRLATDAGRGPLRRFLSQFHNLFIYVLLLAAAMSWALGEPVDALVILGVVVINAVIGFIQEGRAERALAAIRGMIDPHATVLRDGRRLTIEAWHVVPGDIVLVEAGDRVPADMRLIKARSLKVDEAILTGESVAVDKRTEAAPAAAPLGDRLSMAYSGTLVAAGQGTGIVVATGPSTELGRVSRLLGGVESLETPLVRQVGIFARKFTIVVLGVSFVTFLAAYFVRGYAAADAFMAVVGLAVGAIPEGLPAVMTITLAIGVRRMAARNAIIRRLPAVETLGSVSVICSDKTGTFTRNEMTVHSLVTAAGACEVTGVGYAPQGGFRTMAGPFDPAGETEVQRLARIALLCNDADVRHVDGQWIADGDPMEAALVTLAMKAGLDVAATRHEARRLDEIPFDARHRIMATLHDEHSDGRVAFIKGAPERIVEICDSEIGPGGPRPINRDAWIGEADALAARGQRVLGIALRPLPAGIERLDPADIEHGAILVGLVGFIDPPRPDAIAAVAACVEAGIRVVMITGDHAVTAREIGLARHPRVMSGADIDRLDADGLRRAVADTHVFARTTPEHKLRLVEALQDEGLTVAMTGDGVNDAPALKRADVGVAMGRKGTEAAKEASVMVLADDDFASIVAAVREGRTVYDNLKKVIGWTLPTDGGEALTIVAAIAFALPLPVTPVQILWINMVTAVTLGIALAFEPTEPGTMRRPPRPREEPILTGELVWRVVLVSLLFVAGAFGVFAWATARGAPIEEARTLVVNTMVVMEIAYLFSIRHVHGGSLTWRGVLGTPALLLAVGLVTAGQFAFTYVPAFQAVFGSRPVSFGDGLVVLGIGVALLLVAEAEKALRARAVARR